jgi:hypothetical protein
MPVNRAATARRASRFTGRKSRRVAGEVCSRSRYAPHAAVMSLAETAKQDSRRQHQALLLPSCSLWHQSCWQCAITLRSAFAHRLRKLRTSSHAPLREMTHSQFQSSCSASNASPFAPRLRQCHTTPPPPTGTCPDIRSTSQLTNPRPSSPVVVNSRSCATAHLASSRRCITKIMYFAPACRGT